MTRTGMILCQLLLVVVLTASHCLAETTGLSVSATVISKNQCKFRNPSSQTLAFGDLDPLNPVDVTRQATLQFVCNGSSPSVSYVVTDDDGQNAVAPNANRMQHLSSPGNYLPYTFSVSPTSGSGTKGVDITLTVVGTVKGSDYQTAIAGSYADQVVLTVQP